MAADVMFAADRTCCICHESGKQVQIHHIDDDPSHNEPENLAILCLECHAQTQISGGFGRKLNARLVTLYRDHWLTVVQMRRKAETLRSELDRATSKTHPSAGEYPPSREYLQIGETFRNAGIVLSIIDVRTSKSVRLNESNFRTGSGYEELTDVAAGADAKYVTVQTRVLNDTQVSIDLTCGYPIGNHLIDKRGRRFDSIKQLYKLPGNPECNANLQPGFESDMTWIYRIPKDAEIVFFEFQDLADFRRARKDRQPPTQVEIRWSSVPSDDRFDSK